MGIVQEHVQIEFEVKFYINANQMCPVGLQLHEIVNGIFSSQRIDLLIMDLRCIHPRNHKEMCYAYSHFVVYE
jgi:hypothetical protein